MSEAKKVKCKTLQPVSTGNNEKGKPKQFFAIGSIIELPEHEFIEMEKNGAVEKAPPAAKVHEKPELGKHFDEKKRQAEQQAAIDKAMEKTK